jgi:hypothetical protein
MIRWMAGGRFWRRLLVAVRRPGHPRDTIGNFLLLLMMLMVVSARNVIITATTDMQRAEERCCFMATSKIFTAATNRQYASKRECRMMAVSSSFSGSQSSRSKGRNKTSRIHWTSKRMHFGGTTK